MKHYLVALAFVVILYLPTRPFVLAWTWLRTRPLFHGFQELQGRMVALEAAAEKRPAEKPPEPKPPAAS